MEVTVAAAEEEEVMVTVVAVMEVVVEVVMEVVEVMEVVMREAMVSDWQFSEKKEFLILTFGDNDLGGGHEMSYGGGHEGGYGRCSEF